MIEINSLIRAKADENFLKKVAKIVLKGENIDIDKTGLSIVLVSSARIRGLNAKYRRKNRATDVLSFEGNQELGQELGEVVICPSEVEKNAEKFNLSRTFPRKGAGQKTAGFSRKVRDSSFKKELARVLIHGILHLLGEDHGKSKKETQKMEEKEKYYLSRT